MALRIQKESKREVALRRAKVIRPQLGTPRHALIIDAGFVAHVGHATQRASGFLRTSPVYCVRTTQGFPKRCFRKKRISAEQRSTNTVTRLCVERRDKPACCRG